MDHTFRFRSPFVLPVAFLQHPARNTPVRTSEIQPMPPRLRALLGTPVALTMVVDDFSGSVNTGLRELAPLFDVLLDHKRPGDIRTLWVYVTSAYDEGSPLRDLVINAVSKEVKEEFVTIKDAWINEGVRPARSRVVSVGRT